MTKLAPFKIRGKFDDGFEMCVSGVNESDCMQKLISVHQNRAHGDLVYHERVTDENYEDGYLKVG